MEKVIDTKPLDTIEREITEALRHNAYSLSQWLDELGATSPDKAAMAYVRLLDARNKLTDFTHTDVNEGFSLNLIVQKEDKEQLDKFLGEEL
jgi:hypothetical protein